ncbi:MAG: competence/damage-inducible protein A [Bacteroidia bacterium]|nr:competence/damage-inducible protein A [Methylotenera sp.]
MQTFGIYIIGDEILSGKREDKHLRQAIQILKARGLSLAWAEYLGDDPARLVASFKRSLATDTIVFSFGGIGATPDDFTRQAAADALDVPIQRHKEAVAEIEAQFGEAAYPKRVLMADFPKGAAMIPNPFNRVAGFAIGLNPQETSHYFLPGFPSMAWPMTEWVLDTHYSHLFHREAIVESAILVRDAGESQLIDLMNAIVCKHPETKLFSLPRLGTDKLNPTKTIELGVKGVAIAVESAMVDIKAGVTEAGFPWSIINAETK